jgi:hypothetical protein
MKRFGSTTRIAQRLGLGLSLSIVGIGGTVLLPDLAVQAQSLREPLADPSRTVSTLTFRATTDREPLSEFQLSLKEAVPILPTETLILDGDALGPVVLRSALGDRRQLERYRWTVEPASKIYFSRSGYKSFVARYQYSEGQSSPQYVLHIACYTTDLAAQPERQAERQAESSVEAACRLFGNGPLLKGEFQSMGQLALAETSPEPIDSEKTSTSGTSAAYRRGYELGQLDAQQKLERRYVRHRTEFDTDTEADFQRGYENAYGNFTGEERSPLTQSEMDYQGRGALLLYPLTPQGAEERRALNRITLQRDPDGTAQLRLLTESTDAPLTFRGALEPTDGGQVLTLKAVDEAPAQGKLFLSQQGLVRTLEPIFRGTEDQELSVYFRPNP